MLTASQGIELERRIGETVCPKCTEFRADGTCGIERLADCPIRMHLPELLDIVEGVHSDHIADYVERMRSDVCKTCRDSVLPRGQCDLRNEGRCALDVFVLPIVQIVDDYLAEIR